MGGDARRVSCGRLPVLTPISFFKPLIFLFFPLSLSLLLSVFHHSVIVCMAPFIFPKRTRIIGSCTATEPLEKPRSDKCVPAFGKERKKQVSLCKAVQGKSVGWCFMGNALLLEEEKTQVSCLAFDTGCAALCCAVCYARALDNNKARKRKRERGEEYCLLHIKSRGQPMGEDRLTSRACMQVDQPATLELTSVAISSSRI